MRGIAFITTALLAFSVSVGVAGEFTANQDGSSTWDSGSDSVKIDLNLDGSFRRAWSRYSAPVEFADRRGINAAQIISEEKAKAALVRNMMQTNASVRIVGEMQAEQNKMTQERRTGAQPSVTKIDQRALGQALTEITGSFASGNLTGVRVLEKGYDEKREEAWVVVGITQESIKGARALDRAMNQPQQPTVQDSIKLQPSEVQRSR
ncbi:MAG: hypothetical protein ACRD3W_12800 [Terriglobales bacterium]